MARSIRTLAKRAALTGVGLALAAGASLTSAAAAHADTTPGGCGGPAWESACIGVNGSGYITADAYTNFQSVDPNCTVDVILWDYTSNRQVFTSSATCRTGSQHYATSVLGNPTQGHDYKTELQLHWTGGAAYDYQTSPDLVFGGGGSQPAPGVSITMDTSQAGDLAGWASTEQSILQQWYGPTVNLIDGGAYQAPTSYRVVFDPAYNGPGDIAATYWDGSANNLTVKVNPDWVRQHPDDTGFLVHEQVHVVQDGSNLPSGLVEGSADWFRYYNYQPTNLARPDQNTKNTYLAGYSTTAYFLNYVATHYDSNIVRELNDAGHAQAYPVDNADQWWIQHTGKTAQQLWDSMYQ
ncbi:basic secretory protein-like protein [Kitasatospora sp. NBC_01302]|uniref:basic secretory protein-like protein n=1 Tax=Kitasatospora sp. NBC_01302 TaxID=2903575 RepID=UPI002E139318|nr:basic secretory family protein [Kitasatospora sp. NBC_01302]